MSMVIASRPRLGTAVIALFVSWLSLAVIAPCGAAQHHDVTRPMASARVVLEGEAIAVKDGDSIVVLLAEGRRLQVRIGGIDAPEKGQAWGDASRRHLASLLRDHALRVETLKIDRYGRTVANVYVDSVDVGLAQVRAGLAWHFKRYQADQTPAQRMAYASAEREARAERAGLWRDPAPVEPWRHREQQRNAAVR